MEFKRGESAIQKLLFQVMGAFAEFERELRRERQKEGIQAAKAKGKQIGRAKKLTEKQIKQLREEAAEPNANKSVLAKKYGIARKTLYRYLDPPSFVKVSNS